MAESPSLSQSMEATSTRLRTLSAADPYAELLGAKLVDDDPGCLTVELEIEPRHTNFMGLAHGGAVYSLADFALSLISNAEVEAVALDTHLVQSASARAGDRLTATACPATRSRSVATYRITVERGDGRVVALFTGTVFHRGDTLPRAGRGDAPP